MAKRYPEETKEEVLKKIPEGQRVSEVAKACGIHDMTIRTWLETVDPPLQRGKSMPKLANVFIAA